MRILTAHLVERVVTIFIIGLVLSMTGLLFFFLSLRLGAIAKENQAYDKYMACVLSVPPMQRDQSKIDRCFQEARQDTGIDIKIYDK